MKYQLLPPLAQDDLDRLKASIVERGVKMPVVLDEHGEILDGHNRVMIADSLGIEYPTIVESGLDEHEKRIFVAELNAARRQLTTAQKIMLGKQIEPDIAARAAKRKAHGMTAPGRSVTDGTEREAPVRTSAEVAKAVHLGSHMTYERGKKALDELAQEEDGAQLLHHVESGDWDIDDVRQELRTRRKREEAKEVEQVTHAVAEMDTDGRIERARIRSAVSTAIQHVGTNLTPLEPAAVIESLDDNGRYNLESFMRKTRTWFDRVESEMNQGVRLIHRKDA